MDHCGGCFSGGGWISSPLEFSCGCRQYMDHMILLVASCDSYISPSEAAIVN
jgi:hypothetical protein